MSLVIYADFLQRVPADTCTEHHLLHFGHWRDLDGGWNPPSQSLRPRLSWYATCTPRGDYPWHQLTRLQVLPERALRPAEVITTITFAPTRAAWRRAYRLARRLLQADTVIVREPLSARADICVELGPDHEVLVWADTGRACA